MRFWLLVIVSMVSGCATSSTLVNPSVLVAALREEQSAVRTSAAPAFPRYQQLRTQVLYGGDGTKRSGGTVILPPQIASTNLMRKLFLGIDRVLEGNSERVPIDINEDDMMAFADASAFTASAFFKEAPSTSGGERVLGSKPFADRLRYYLKHNPVEFVQKHTWDNFLHSYLAKAP